MKVVGADLVDAVDQATVRLFGFKSCWDQGTTMYSNQKALLRAYLDSQYAVAEIYSDYVKLVLFAPPKTTLIVKTLRLVHVDGAIVLCDKRHREAKAQAVFAALAQT